MRWNDDIGYGDIGYKGNRHLIARSFSYAFLSAVLALGSLCLAQDSAAPLPLLKKIPSESLPNALQLNARLISGGLPDGEEAFAQLRDLGVKTIISVDGATPDVATAEKHGLRYVHLPHGYDGISPERSLELAKAIRDLPGPIYLHCHHGKHRSPAASATACRALGWLDEQQATEVLQLAGTSPHYLGLFAAVRETKPLEPAQLDRLQVEFRPTVPLPEVAEAMVAMEQHFDRLEQLAAGDWQPLPRHPDLKPAHEALLLREQFTELLRTESVRAEPAAYRDQLRAGRTAPRSSHTGAIRRGRHSTESPQSELYPVPSPVPRPARPRSQSALKTSTKAQFQAEFRPFCLELNLKLIFSTPSRSRAR
jgi:protein tyrosine phosphatase (PTP) superfamily phosphohydrolase (DUF442 family)